MQTQSIQIKKIEVPSIHWRCHNPGDVLRGVLLLALHSMLIGSSSWSLGKVLPVIHGYGLEKDGGATSA
jgi:hypothetical protein